MSHRTLLVTIDTEVDKDAHWRISNPVGFHSVTNGVPSILTPLFEKYGVKPTYFLSPEVIENEACAAALKSVGPEAELAAHLHSEFIGPERTLFPDRMGGARADGIQKQLARDVERAKLSNLTSLFTDVFGYRPSAFRAGRYGMSEHTLELLAELGYKVDSSVTPGMRWDYPEGVIDFKQWQPGPKWMTTRSGTILEIPLSIRPRMPFAAGLRRLAPAVLDRAVQVLGQSRSFKWLRPSWNNGAELIDYVRSSDERVFNMMFHSNEIIAGASPYAQTEADVRRIVDAMDALFAYCVKEGFHFSRVSDVREWM